MRRKIRGSEAGLEYLFIVLNFFFKSKALHYGYWEEGDRVEFWNFGNAQEKYTEILIGNIPADVKSILDVGSGAGVVAKRLIERGYDVECLSPSSFLNEEARKILPDGTKIHQTKFEEFETDRIYDLILFSESFQYVNMRKSFAQCSRLLKPGGYILICDVFKLDTPGKSPIGGGHSYRDYLEVRKSFPFLCIKDIDISRNIAPTVDVIHDLSINLIKPLWENFLKILKINHPFASKFLLWIFKREIQKIKKHFNPQRTAEGFLKYKTYRIQLLKKA